MGLGDRKRLLNWRLRELGSSLCPVTPHAAWSIPQSSRLFLEMNASNRIRWKRSFDRQCVLFMGRSAYLVLLLAGEFFLCKI